MPRHPKLYLYIPKNCDCVNMRKYNFADYVQTQANCNASLMYAKELFRSRCMLV